MKKFLLLLILISSTYMSRSQDLKEIESVAYLWLTSYYTFDIPGALAHSTDETAEFINMIQEMIDVNPIPDTIMTTLKKTRIEFEEDGTTATGREALVRYWLIMPAESEIEPLRKVLKLVNQDGQWLVQYTMEDAMNETSQNVE